MSQPRFAWGTPAFTRALAERFDPTVQRVATLAAELCAVPGVSVPATKVDFAPLARAADLASDYARRHGLRVLQPPAEPGAPYPFLAITFAAAAPAVPVPRSLIALIGHLDVVPAQRPEQFEPYLSGDDLYARGAADMKTVVASYLVWMAERQARGGPQPPLVLLLSCCEENGSAQRHHLASALPWLERTCGASVRFAVVGERTGELEWMQPELTLGPICRENRSWRWLRASSERARGLAALQRAARALAHARTTIHRLNEEATPAAKAARQPGLRSGLVNAFCRIAADDAPFAPAAACWLRVERAPGGAMHAAAAQVSQPSLLEALAQVAERAVETFGPARVKLGGVSLGQEDNFNTYDGAGAMTLALAGVTAEQGAAWAAGAAGEGLSIATCGSPPEPAALPSVLGLDLRELLDHQPAVERLLGELEQTLLDGAQLTRVLAAPAWRCPELHPDLQALAAAYEQVAGHPSPDLVKLHGNDGGHLVAYLQARVPNDSAAAQRPATGEGPVVVFGQVGMRPHGIDEYHRLTSVQPYLEVLERWADALVLRDFAP